MPNFEAWTPTDWTAFGTLATAAVALAAAIFAGIQVTQARKLREEQARPFVVVDVQPSPVWMNILNLVIENVGRTLARNVSIKFDPTIETSQKGYDLAGSALIAGGIPSLPPGRRIEALFDVSHERLEAGLPFRYDVVVSYDDWKGSAQEPMRFVIDLDYLMGLQGVEEYGLHHAAKALREMSSEMKKWTGSSPLKVWTRDEDARNLDRRIEMDLTGRRPALGNTPPSDLVMWLGKPFPIRTSVKWLREAHERRREKRKDGD